MKQPYYLKSGRVVPGVTGVIGGNLGWGMQMLMGWSRKLALKGIDPNKVRDEAGNFGTAIHKAVEAEILGQPIELLVEEVSGDGMRDFNDSELIRYHRIADGFRLWKYEHQVSIEACEVPLVSEEFGYGGTIDLDATVMMEKTLVDLKTSGHVSGSHLLQLVAYRQLYKENFGFLPRIGLLHLGKGETPYQNGMPPYLRWEEAILDKAWEAFLCLLRLNELKKDLEL